MESHVRVEPLHEHNDLMDDCVELLNSYWSRSKTARMVSLEKSCDSLPCSLIMIQERGGKSEVIGHSRVMAAQGVENACYIESVVVRSDLRGKGFGKKIMLESEKYASKKGFKQIFLNTIDKQAFYEHLGYLKSSPVLILGANANKLPCSMINQLLKADINTTGDSSTSTCSISCAPSIPPPVSPLPSAIPPPVPPLPPVIKKTTQGTCNTQAMDWCCDPSKTTWMKKYL